MNSLLFLWAVSPLFIGLTIPLSIFALPFLSITYIIRKRLFLIFFCILLLFIYLFNSARLAEVDLKGTYKILELIIFSFVIYKVKYLESTKGFLFLFASLGIFSIMSSTYLSGINENQVAYFFIIAILLIKDLQIWQKFLITFLGILFQANTLVLASLLLFNAVRGLAVRVFLVLLLSLSILLMSYDDVLSQYYYSAPTLFIRFALWDSTLTYFFQNASAIDILFGNPYMIDTYTVKFSESYSMLHYTFTGKDPHNIIIFFLVNFGVVATAVLVIAIGYYFFNFSKYRYTCVIIMFSLFEPSFSFYLIPIFFMMIEKDEGLARANLPQR